MIKAKLFWQVAITIAILIVSIEAVYLYFSISAKQDELLEIRKDLDADAIQMTGKTFTELHPEILNDADIKRRLTTFQTNIIQMVAVLTLTVVGGTLVVFYFIAMRPLLRLTEAIRNSKAPDYLRFDGPIPPNEIGELIMARERQIDRIANYQDQLENQVDELRREVIQSEKLGMIGEFSAGIIHDLNNPLQLLVFHLDELAEELRSSTPDHQQALKTVEDSKYATDKIHGLIQRMSGFVRTSDQQPEYFSIAESVADVTKLLESRFKKSGLKLAVEVPEELECLGQEQDIEQVLVNLLSNAIDALESSSAPYLEISACMRGDDLLAITVRDNGTGIPECEQEKIFKSLYTTKPAGKGTGLGLSNVTRIVADHGGKVELNSTSGQGTEFKVCLPGRVT